MTQKVVDASALLAAIHNEPGGELVQQQIEQCTISTVNWSEVLQKLARKGADTEAVARVLLALGLTIVDFSERDAHIAADLWSAGKSKGLSLADRACLALGRRLDVPVITADKAWVDVDHEVVVELIR